MVASCRVAGVAVLLAGVVPLADASAQPAVPDGPDGLTLDEKRAFIGAVSRNELVTARAIAVAAIAADPNRAGGVVRDVVELAPDQADEIVGHLAEVFPKLADRLRAVAADASKVSDKAKVAEQLPAAETEAAAPDGRERVQNLWSGETVVGGSYRSAAQSSTTASAAFRIAHETGLWRNSAGLEFDYGQTNDVTNDQRLFVEGRSRRDLTERLYGFGMASYEDDRFSGFDYQFTEGVGVGYRLFDLDDFELSVEGGPSLRQSRVTETGQLNREVLGRVATILEWHISDTAVFSNETALLFSRNTVEATSNVYGELRDGAESTNMSALDVQIIGNLAGRLSYEIHYRSDPPPNGVATETTGKASLVHSF